MRHAHRWCAVGFVGWISAMALASPVSMLDTAAAMPRPDSSGGGAGSQISNAWERYPSYPRLARPFGPAPAARFIYLDHEIGTSSYDQSFGLSPSVALATVVALNVLTIMETDFADDLPKLDPLPRDRSYFSELVFERNTYAACLRLLADVDAGAGASERWPVRGLYGYDGMKGRYTRRLCHREEARSGGDVPAWARAGLRRLPSVIARALSRSTAPNPRNGDVPHLVAIDHNEVTAPGHDEALASGRATPDFTAGPGFTARVNQRFGRSHALAAWQFAAQVAGPSAVVPAVISHLVGAIDRAVALRIDQPTMDGAGDASRVPRDAVDDWLPSASAASSARRPSALSFDRGPERGELREGTDALVVRHHVPLIVPEPATVVLLALAGGCIATRRAMFRTGGRWRKN